MKKVVVLGGSAGGITALCSILRNIPAGFPAPLLTVIHVPEESNSLPAVLQRCCDLTVVDPQEPAPLRPGHVYVAPPNRHLIVRGGCATAVMGPRENRHRPAVDTLFRSAARAYRRSVVAVVISGALDDGSAGALAVKSRGGTVIVQDPNEAEVPDMPANVIRQVKRVRCMKLDQIPPLLMRLASAPNGADLPEAEQCRPEKTTVDLDEPLALTCPECGGAVLQTQDAKTVQWRCHVGHRFSLESFTEAHADAVERALWVALRKLKEKQTIATQLSNGQSASSSMRHRFEENAAAAAHDIHLLEEVLTRLGTRQAVGPRLFSRFA